MKTIGLIGGLSWESSALYYKFLNQHTRTLLGGSHSAKILMYSFDFQEIAEMQAGAEWGKIESTLISAAKVLENGGADLIIVCSNSMHKFASAITANIGVPLLHICDAISELIISSKLTKVGLIGTKFSMEESFLIDVYNSHGIEVIVPDINARDKIHNIIYEELVRGISNPTSKEFLISTCSEFKAKGAQGVIAGCTEIELILQPSDIELELFASTYIHSVSAVQMSLI